MFEQAMKTVSSALFPLFYISNVTENGSECKASGSAFFIDTDGTFLTCCHTLKAAPVDKYRYLGRLPHAPHHPPLEIEILYLDEGRDIGVGRVRGVHVPGILTLEADEPGPGASVCICGYPPFEKEDGSPGEIFAPYPQPTFVVNQIGMTSQGVTRRVLLLRDNPLFGMSGGPVVNSDGRVVGLQTAVFKPRFNRNDDRFFKVEHGIATAADSLKDAIRLAKDEGKQAPGDVA